MGFQKHLEGAHSFLGVGVDAVSIVCDKTIVTLSRLADTTELLTKFIHSIFLQCILYHT